MTRPRAGERCGHCGHEEVLPSGMAKKRNRPTLTVTIDPDVHERLRSLVDQLPGATLSVLLDELLIAALPIFEDMAAAIRGAQAMEGGYDESVAQDTLAALIGARILRASGLTVQDTSTSPEKGGDPAP